MKFKTSISVLCTNQQLSRVLSGDSKLRRTTPKRFSSSRYKALVQQLYEPVFSRSPFHYGFPNVIYNCQTTSSESVLDVFVSHRLKVISKKLQIEYPICPDTIGLTPKVDLS